MNTISLTAGEARDLFSNLRGQILAQKKGLGITEVRSDAFFDDQFIVTGHANYDKVPLPRHIKFEHDTTYIINAPCLPEVLEANELTLDRPTNADAFLFWDISGIQKISCGPLTLVDPGQFPRFIEASDIQVEISEEGMEGDPDLSNRRIELTAPDLWPHIQFLVFLGGLPLASVMGLELLIDGLHLHEWANQPCIITQWKGCTKKVRTTMDHAVSCYKSSYAAKAALTSIPLPTHGIIIDLDLA